jgi:hypothetical protein
MIDPVKLAKDNGLWPTFDPVPKEQADNEETSTIWRDGVRSKIKKLVADYIAWAQSEKGIVDDPGRGPEPIKMPMEMPDPTDTVEKHHEYRRVTDLWYNTEYMIQHLPEHEVWAVANGLWQAKLDKQRATAISRKRSAFRWVRFLAYLLLAGLCVGFLGWTLLIYLGLPEWIAGSTCGMASVLALFGVDFIFNKIEDRLARRQEEVETAREREAAQKAIEERQRLLQRLGIPDDTKPKEESR